jgi:hypothetical protein
MMALLDAVKKKSIPSEIKCRQVNNVFDYYLVRMCKCITIFANQDMNIRI